MAGSGPRARRRCPRSGHGGRRRHILAPLSSPTVLSSPPAPTPRRRHPRDLAAWIWSVLAVLLNDGGGGASSPALTGDGGADWSWSRSRRSGRSFCSGIKVGLLHSAFSSSHLSSVGPTLDFLSEALVPSLGTEEASEAMGPTNFFHHVGRSKTPARRRNAHCEEPLKG
ncbi:hypothetical protein OsI_08146 [Oryza sativa Indica Group]|uniref:Uncharacterized protein n=1 Tax=Oryza sativa subsp. indica TaxID=39946 RepID=A2X7F6_ORYSI|nr:hypothetical protein OsI_08146 [Oryza sativa Indica Group]